MVSEILGVSLVHRAATMAMSFHARSATIVLNQFKKVWMASQSSMKTLVMTRVASNSGSGGA